MIDDEYDTEDDILFRILSKKSVVEYGIEGEKKPDILGDIFESTVGVGVGGGRPPSRDFFSHVKNIQHVLKNFFINIENPKYSNC